MRRVYTPETSQVQAYEYYVKGRQAFSQFGRESFEEAQKLYEKAIEIDQNYALAYAGLGSIHIFRFIEQTDPRDLDIGISYLQKGLQYDPDLADCEIWLTYAHTRKQQFDQAIDAGLRAVALDRDNFMAHYFLGTAYTIKASMKCAPSLYADALRHLKRSTELQTNYGPSHMILAWIFMLQGQYQEAKSNLDRAVAIEESEKFEGVRFVGALTLMGDLYLRQNRLDAATDLYHRSLDLLEKREHFYKHPFIALTHCNLGYANLARGKYDEALDNFRHSCQVIEKNPKGLGIGYFLVRARLGMAEAFHKLGMTREAEQHFNKSLELFRQKLEFDFSWIWEGTDAQAHYDLASYFALTKQPELAFEHLRKAAACGWRDVPQLEVDDNLNALRGMAEYLQILQDLKSREPLS